MEIIEALVPILIPLGVIVALPVLVIWLICRMEMNKDNRNAEIIIKTIEKDSSVDTDKLVAALGKREKTPLQILHLRLLRGCIFTFAGSASAIIASIANLNDQDLYNFILIVSGLSLAVGIAYLVVYFATRKSACKESDNDK